MSDVANRSAAAGSASLPASDCELSTSRVLPASPEVVYRAWTEAQHLARWWGPNGFRNTFHEFEPRPGGQWKFTMHGPDGHDYANHSRFLEMVPASRIVLEHLSAPHFIATATFEAVPGGTRVSLRQRFDDAKICAAIAKFAVDANEQNLDRLTAELVHVELPAN